MTPARVSTVLTWALAVRDPCEPGGEVSAPVPGR